MYPPSAQTSKSDDSLRFVPDPIPTSIHAHKLMTLTEKSSRNKSLPLCSVGLKCCGAMHQTDLCWPNCRSLASVVYLSLSLRPEILHVKAWIWKQLLAFKTAKSHKGFLGRVHHKQTSNCAQGWEASSRLKLCTPCRLFISWRYTVPMQVKVKS